MSDLFAQIDAVLAFDTVETVTFRIPTEKGAAIALAHERGKVLAEVYDKDSCVMEVQAPESLRRRLRQYRVESSTSPVENSVQKLPH